MSWQLTSATATLESSSWNGVLDLENPQNGFAIESDDGLKTSLFPIALAPMPATPLLSECYVRQGDLIVVYPPVTRTPSGSQESGRPFSLQLDYRILPIESHIKSTLTTAANPLEKGLLVELWISLQTYLLDTHPSVEMDLHLNPTSAPPSTHPIAILSGTCPPSGLQVTYFVDPHDQRDTKWRHHDVHHKATFFGHFMEKGVIRRARLRCLVTRKPVCSDFIADQYQQLVESPLPLTT
jgi:hypothetical protein